MRAYSGGDRRAPQSPAPSHRGVASSRRIISKTETVTNLTLRGGEERRRSNSFEPLRCSNHAENKRKRRQSPRPESREWVYSSRDFFGDEDKVVVVSYNILGVENASKHPDLYSKVQPQFLAWGWRKRLIHEEIKRYNPSIMCFQEVDHFNEVDDLLQKDGFKGTYKARTGEALDGCAIFWKDKRFTLLHEENIEFQSFGLRNNVAQLCVLKIKRRLSKSKTNPPKSKHPSSRCLLVGNIHALFNPNRGDIKLGQKAALLFLRIRLFLEKARKLSQDWGAIPIVIAGDLNSLPQSAIYEFLTSSKLDIKLHDRRQISGQVQDSFHRRAFRYQNKNTARPVTFRWSSEEIKLATGSERVTHLQTHLKLFSAYLGVPGSNRTRDENGEPLATSYHSKFMGTVDYIWHTEGLVPVRVLETLPIRSLRNIGGLPSQEWGSDHLALVCELAFVDTQNKT